MPEKITVMISAAGSTAMNEMYRSLLADERLSIVTFAPTTEQMTTALSQQPVEVAVIDAELLAEGGERGIMQFLAHQLGNAIAIVLLPQPMANLKGMLINLDRVHDVLIKPVNYAHLGDRCYQVALSMRVSQSAMAPATDFVQSATAKITGAGRAMAMAGTRVFAVCGGKGGPGKTTIAVNLWYRLNQVSIPTLLMGFDVPDAVGVQLDLPMAPNSMNWFRRQGREGFAASIQKKDGFDVVLSPNEKVEASRIAAIAPDEPGSIRGLVEAARDHSPPYGAYVLDLPPTESEWSIQPLLRANTVLLVCEPDLASMVNLVATVRLLTGVLDDRYKVPLDAIFAVLSRVNPEDTLTPERMQNAIRDRLDGWAPPFVAVIPSDPGVRACQIDGVPPVARRQEFAKGIDQIVDHFYADQLGKSSSKAAGGKGRSFFGIKVRIK
jgi:cellulose biosynthesis protein BcsQ